MRKVAVERMRVLKPGFILHEDIIKMQWKMKSTRDKWFGNKYDFYHPSSLEVLKGLLSIKDPLEIIDVKFGRKAAYRELNDYYLVVICDVYSL